MDDIHNAIGAINTKRKTLFILCGYPYAGKSYIASQLIERTGVAYVSIDSIFHARGFDWDSNKLPHPDEWAQIFDESYAQATKYLVAGKNVLYDSTNHAFASREKLRGVARAAGAEAVVIYVRTTKEIVWERRAASAKEDDRHAVSRELVAGTLDSFEPPVAPREHVLTIRN